MLSSAMENLIRNARKGDISSILKIADICRLGNEEVEKSIDDAIYWYRSGAELGNPDALYHLGLLYLYGEGVEINPSEAIRCLEESIEHGGKEACYELGHLFECGEYVPRSVEHAEEVYLKAPDSIKCMSALGMLYYSDGQFGKALEYLSRISGDGFAKERFCLSNIYYYGLDTGENIPKSEQILISLSDDGYVPAYFALGLVEGHLSSMIRDLSDKLSKKDLSVSYLKKGLDCLTRENGMGKGLSSWIQGKFAHAEDFALLAAEVLSDSELVSKLDLSEFTFDLYSQSMKFLLNLKNAVESENPLLASVYYDIYQEVKGSFYSSNVDNDVVQWLDLSAALDYGSALVSLGDLIYFSNEKELSVRYYERAVEQGNTDAMCSLALMYYYGDVVDKDVRRAEHLFHDAAELGNADAIKNLEKIHEYQSSPNSS